MPGRKQDKEVLKKAGQLARTYPGRLYLIPRALSENEVAALYSLANVAVMPYRSILISGSFYLPTTFAVPSIAPNIGMFKEAINDGISGYQYNGEVAGLQEMLLSVIITDLNKLRAVGAKAYMENAHRSSEWFSKNYFDSLKNITASARS